MDSKSVKLKACRFPLLRYRTHGSQESASQADFYVEHIEWERCRNLGTGGLAEVVMNRKQQQWL